MQDTLSNKALLKATVIAVFIAGLVLVSFILPAEYNIDPTGIGAKLGLTALANPKAAVVSGAETKATIDVPKSVQAADIIEVIIPAGRGLEFKFAMEKFKKMEYQWQTDGAAIFFDLHGEPEGDTTGYYESYAIATLADMQGSFTTPFAGVHGWYWKNKSAQAVVITLTVSGEYSVIGLKK
ncbi:hypothetical protein CMT41_17440 [Colwellia sp. MT41]|uniref:hypothetical protein n=1 Tax=Colwellia sp. MT41 TaxID=58049 RepID=UPI000717A9B6|nr:hypothetical protein [Colwellia sp. MT41]ALO36318.1 hypothetical protein CMT41_17440 [Colwellia sp. MT41]